MDPDEINELSKALPSSTKEALFNPAADAVGRGIGGILYFIFQKPIKLGIIKQSEFDSLAEGLSDRLSQVPEKNRTNAIPGFTLTSLGRKFIQTVII